MGQAAIPSGKEKTEMWLEQRVWVQTLGDQGLPGWRKMGYAHCSVDGGKDTEKGRQRVKLTFACASEGETAVRDAGEAGAWVAPVEDQSMTQGLHSGMKETDI